MNHLWQSTLFAAAVALLALLAVVWILGFAVALSTWWTRWQRILDSHAGGDTVADGGAGQGDVCTHGPGIRRLRCFRPMLLLPNDIAGRLTPEQLKAILAHELCHIRRRDNLAAAMHMVVQAA